MEGRMRHPGVVLLDVELHQGAESGKRVERVEVEPAVLERAERMPRSWNLKRQPRPARGHAPDTL
jgi:hypothetical protein